jgi:hypothetical protein
MILEFKAGSGDYTMESDGEYKLVSRASRDWTMKHCGEEIFCRGTLNADDMREMASLLLAAAEWMEDDNG